MPHNLKYKVEINTDIPSLKSYLLDFSPFLKISALQQIDSSNADSLLDEIKICAYDYRANVRMNAYYALQFCNPEKITEILKDALRDEDTDAFKAARQTYSYFNKK